MNFKVCFKLRNNSTVFEELSVSIVDLTVANAVLLATRSGDRKTEGMYDLTVVDGNINSQKMY